MQKPDATRVAGFNAWKKDFKRSVNKGEKGIKIIAPAPFKTKQEVDKLDGNGKPVIGTDGKRVKEEKEVTIPAFTVATVFDVSQTDGEPLPQLGVSELTGSVEQYKDFFAAVEKVSPVPVDFEKIKTGAKGYFHLEEKRIAINEGMSDVQNLKTLIHEIAHARIHDITRGDGRGWGIISTRRYTVILNTNGTVDLETSCQECGGHIHRLHELENITSVFSIGDAAIALRDDGSLWAFGNGESARTFLGLDHTPRQIEFRQ